MDTNYTRVEEVFGKWATTGMIYGIEVPAEVVKSEELVNLLDDIHVPSTILFQEVGVFDPFYPNKVVDVQVFSIIHHGFRVAE